MTEKNSYREKRSFKRVAANIPVKYRVIDDPKEISADHDPERKKEKVTQSRDISSGGLYIITEQPVNIGSTLRLDLSLPKHSKIISAFAEVVWGDAAGKGLKFIAVKEADEVIIREYVNKIA